MEIKRDIHLNRIIARKGNGMIKVITGIRRCGKSYLLFTLFTNYLKSQGVDEQHIIKVDLEDRRNAFLRNPDAGFFLCLLKVYPKHSRSHSKKKPQTHHAGFVVFITFSAVFADKKSKSTAWRKIYLPSY